MSSGREAAERIKREKETRESQENDSVANQANLNAGSRPFWQHVQDAMTRELDAFKEGIRPHADTLQGQSANSNNFTVYWAGLRTLEVIFNEQIQKLESTFHNRKEEMKEIRILALGYDDVRGVNIDGKTAEQVADDLLKPIFDSYL